MGRNLVGHFLFALKLVFLFVLELSFERAAYGFAQGRSSGSENCTAYHGSGDFGDALQNRQGFLEESAEGELLAGLVLEFVFLLEFVLAFTEQAAEAAHDGAELLFALILVFELV